MSTVVHEQFPDVFDIVVVRSRGFIFIPVFESFDFLKGKQASRRLDKNGYVAVSLQRYS